MNSISRDDHVSAQVAHLAGNDVAELDVDTFLFVIIGQCCQALAGTVVGLAVAGLGGRRLRHRLGAQAVKVGAQDQVQAAPVAHVVPPRHAEDSR